jgi:hypothetical protein
MIENLNYIFLDMTKKLAAFLPALFAGLLLVGIGWLLGWFVKRLVVQLLVFMKLDTVLLRFSWGKAFSKADVRYGFYGFIGNIFFLVVFLIFLDFALITWDLKFLSDLVGRGIFILPKTVGAIAIFGAGWLAALWASRAVRRELSNEQVPGSALIAYFIKVMLIIFFSSIAIFELDIAREIVIIGFAAASVTLGAIAVILASIFGRGRTGLTGPARKEERTAEITDAGGEGQQH